MHLASSCKSTKKGRGLQMVLRILTLFAQLFFALSSIVLFPPKERLRETRNALRKNTEHVCVKLINFLTFNF
jgi:hypothetical protein